MKHKNLNANMYPLHEKIIVGLYLNAKNINTKNGDFKVIKKITGY